MSRFKYTSLARRRGALDKSKDLGKASTIFCILSEEVSTSKSIETSSKTRLYNFSILILEKCSKAWMQFYKIV